MFIAGLNVSKTAFFHLKFINHSMHMALVVFLSGLKNCMSQLVR